MKLHFSATGLDMTVELEKYAAKKVSRLERIMPKQMRSHADCIIHFKQVHRGDNKINTCTLTLNFADQQLTATEATVHMYAALDIACVHIEHQLADYAAAHHKRRIRRILRRPFSR